MARGSSAAASRSGTGSSSFTDESILYGTFSRRHTVITDDINSLWDFPALRRWSLEEYGNVGFAWLNALHDLYQREDKDTDAISIERFAVGTADDDRLVIINKVIAEYGFGEEVDLTVWHAAKGDACISQSIVSAYPDQVSSEGFTFNCSLGQLHIVAGNQGYLDGALLKPLS